MIVSSLGLSKKSRISQSHLKKASWSDHARDLLHMINHFRRDMPRPLVGIGHSMGGNNL